MSDAIPTVTWTQVKDKAMDRMALGSGDFPGLSSPTPTPPPSKTAIAMIHDFDVRVARDTDFEMSLETQETDPTDPGAGIERYLDNGMLRRAWNMIKSSRDPSPPSFPTRRSDTGQENTVRTIFAEAYKTIFAFAQYSSICAAIANPRSQADVGRFIRRVLNSGYGDEERNGILVPDSCLLHHAGVAIHYLSCFEYKPWPQNLEVYSTYEGGLPPDLEAFRILMKHQGIKGAAKKPHGHLGQILAYLLTFYDLGVPTPRLFFTSATNFAYQARLEVDEARSVPGRRAFNMLMSPNMMGPPLTGPNYQLKGEQKVEHIAAQNLLRSNPESYDSLCEFALWFSLRSLESLWEYPTEVELPLPQVPDRVGAIFLALQFAVSWTLILGTMRDLRLVKSPILSWLLYLFFRPLHLDLRLRHEGNQAAIWIDHKKGVVMKRMFSEDVSRKEWAAYQRLRGLPWIPRILGKSGEVDRPALFMVYEGDPVSMEDWGELEPTLRSWVRVLHSRGVHHHDIAPRNVLRDKGGKLTLIDFELTPEQCQGGEDCPDIDLEGSWFQ